MENVWVSTTGRDFRRQANLFLHPLDAKAMPQTHSLGVALIPVPVRSHGTSSGRWSRWDREVMLGKQHLLIFLE